MSAYDGLISASEVKSAMAISRMQRFEDLLRELDETLDRLETALSPVLVGREDDPNAVPVAAPETGLDAQLQVFEYRRARLSNIIDRIRL